MCAICGIINSDGEIDRELLQRMTRVMDYRGPDEEGYLVKNKTGLGHRRLKIIDLHTGQQPMSNEDHTLFLVCNGEVYNFQELRNFLEKKGHRFKSASDNEVILHLYEEKGDKSLDCIRGMFAFAIWDDKKKELFLARDRLGEKPLVYAVIPDGLVFASEIKALLLHPQVTKEIDPFAIDLFLTYQAVPSPYTIFKGIKKILPAHYLVWKNGEISKNERYWDVDFTKKVVFKTQEEYAELLWEKLTESTELCMVSDVPVGAFLSGGIDSSTVVGIMSRLSSRKVKTFSIDFDVKNFSEITYARKVAQRFGTEHYEFIVKPDIIEILPRLIWHYNEPFGDSSMVPSYYMASQTKKYLTVALSGDGGDENLAGYTRYWQTLLLEKIVNFTHIFPQSIRKSVLSYLLKGYEKHPSNTFFRIWQWVAETEKYGYDYAYARRLISFAPGYKQEIYSTYMKEQLKEVDALSFVSNMWEKAGGISLLEKMMYTDQHLYLPEVLTVKMDIAAMANSLEVRSPFLDHKFIETVASFPPELKFKGKTSKYILKKKLKGFLPDEILQRQKMGFGLPVGKWFEGKLEDYLKSILLSERLVKRGFFEKKSIEQMVQQHIAGKINHTSRLWNLLCFEIWCRIFIDGELKFL